MSLSKKDHNSNELVGYWKCEECGGEIVNSGAANVCKECGLEKDGAKNYKTYRPYSKTRLQTEPIFNHSRTTIGTAMERRTSGNSNKYWNWEYLSSRGTRENRVLKIAGKLFRQVASNLRLVKTDEMMQELMEKFKRLRALFKPGTKNRNVQRLVAMTVLAYTRVNNKPINTKVLADMLGLSKRDMNDAIKIINRECKDYKVRDKKGYVEIQLYGLCEHFRLGTLFYLQCRKLLDKMWPDLKIRKQEVISGTIVAVVYLSLGACEDSKSTIPIVKFCNFLEIVPSAIVQRIKYDFATKFRLKGYESPQKSRLMLRELLIDLGVFSEVKNSSNLEKSVSYSRDTTSVTKLISPQ